MALPAGNPGIEGLGPRVISSLVMIPVALALASAGGVYFNLLVLSAALVMAYEWNTLCNDGAKPVGVALVGAIVAIVGGAAFGGVTFALIGLVLGAAVCLAVGRATGARSWWSAVGVIYIALPCISLVWLRQDPAFGLETVLWLFAVVWATDIGAYFAGRGVGGPKIAPRISPNKTWAGLAGGIASAVVIGLATVGLLDIQGSLVFVILGAALAIVAQVGDLWESWVKRRFSAKDSGRIIPGHGGLLDRLDGLMTVAPAVAAIVSINGSVLAWR